METWKVRIRSKGSLAVLQALAKAGLIEIEKDPSLSEIMREIRKGVKNKLTVAEVIAEVDAVRAQRYAASRKAQARR